MKKNFPLYSPRLKHLARDLRNNSTLSELLLWKELKGKQMLGCDFHRQKPIDRYIVDFFCPELMLPIEIDGESHVLREANDAERQRRLEQMGIHFLRFDDLDVKFQMETVLNAIRVWIRKNNQNPNP